ncbi:hypothetical protein DE146DRAFT_631973 [Phaeosphaeria sp. MPI-PUGE-AT-0046c]|nr:hypothetical protein DE146DRAFT_631973 [Phaeosphaeria sp. MPI-PUGE-AT-0046c]
MTTTVGGLSTSVIAVIAVSGIGALLILITVAGFCCDLPARLRRRKNAKEGGRASPLMDEVDLEKRESTISVRDVSSQHSKSTQQAWAPLPLCACEHPNPITNQSAIHSSRMHLQSGPV